MPDFCSRITFKFLKIANDNNAFSMVELFKFACKTNDIDEFVKVFWGEKASTGFSSLKARRDICFKCPYDQNYCFGKEIKDHEVLYSEILRYRYLSAQSIMNNLRNPDNQVNMFESINPIIIKFATSYGASFNNKHIFKALGIIVSPVLDKSIGKYCPFADEWRIDKNALCL